MTLPFTRQLGARSGVQLNPVIDNSERFVAGNSDQSFAVVGRFERGRIDKPFRVDRSQLYRLLGQPSSLNVNALNETFLHIYEAFQSGASSAVVYRLSVAAAEIKRISIMDDASAANVYPAPAATAAAGCVLSFKHLECVNEGIKVSVYAPETLDALGVKVATKEIVLRLSDLKGVALFPDFAGSLDPQAKDAFGLSRYLPDVISGFTDLIEIDVVADEIDTTCAFYGKDVDGNAKFVSKDLSYFVEGGTGYANIDYDNAIVGLRYADEDFGYIIGGGTRAPALLSKLISLGKLMNKQVLWDIPSEYTVSQALAFYAQLNIDTHYSQCYWSPLLCSDPLNGGKAYFGTSAINVGYRCARNALTDANGVAPKVVAIAGRDYPIARTGIIQKVTPTENELDALAELRINAVLFVKYTSGGRYVFTDSLTGAKTEADRKLIAVAEMSSAVDDVVSAYCQEALQKPMQTAITMISDFLQPYFEAIETAKWIKPSAELGNRSFVATVKANASRPSDRIDVSYALKFDGTARAIYIQQTISK